MDTTPRRIHLMLMALMCLLLHGTTNAADILAERVEHTLSLAEENRGELEQVLAHYEQLGDAEKLDAARWLIANMPGHGYRITVLYDADGNEIPYDALDHANFKEALAALDALEAEHGTIDFKPKTFIEDANTISAAYLITNIDLAFHAWRTHPWAQEIPFEVFREYILPYRGSNEPLNDWRPACMARLAETYASLEDPDNLKTSAQHIRQTSGGWIGFNEIYYLHPTDQGYDEMCRTKLGRCEDMTNLYTYAMRASAVLCAADFTPYWANRDNNHAWEVMLNADGTGKAGLFNMAAKVYRKTFSVQDDALGTVKTEDEDAPKYLNSKTYRDVTADYLETTDVTVDLTADVPEGERFAFICVFNGGVWRPIHYGWIREDGVTFTNLGRGIVYLPAYFVDEQVVPAAVPFILNDDGDVAPLHPIDEMTISIEIAITIPDTPDHDTMRTKPRIKVKTGETYELSIWRDGAWKSLGKKEAGDEPVSFDAVPAGGLYWLVAEGGRKLERIFTIENGTQIFW